MGSAMGMIPGMSGGSNQATGSPTSIFGAPDLGAELLAPSKATGNAVTTVPNAPASQAPASQAPASPSNSSNAQNSMDLISQMTQSLGQSPQGGGTLSNPSSQYSNQGMPFPNNGLNLGNPQNMLNGMGGN